MAVSVRAQSAARADQAPALSTAHSGRLMLPTGARHRHWQMRLKIEKWCLEGVVLKVARC